MTDFKINNTNDLKRMLEYIEKNAIKESLKETGDKVAEEVVKEEINNKVYKKYHSPVDYERTFQLRDSVKVTNQETTGNVSTVEIGHDTNLIGSYKPNQHYSVVDGSSSVESIAEIVHDGKSGHIFGKGVWTEPRPYMDVSKDRLSKSKEHVKFMKESLKKKGIKTE